MVKTGLRIHGLLKDHGDVISLTFSISSLQVEEVSAVEKDLSTDDLPGGEAMSLR